MDKLDTLCSKGKWIEALILLHQMQYNNPDDKSILNKIKDIDHKIKKTNSTLLTKDPFKNKKQAEDMLLLLHKKSYSKLIEIVQKKLKLFRNSFFLLYMFGIAKISLRQFDEAEFIYKKIVSINPYHFEINFNLASIYLEKQELDKALLFSEIAYVLMPKNARISHYLSICHKSKGNIIKALYFANKSLKIEPDNTLYVNNKIDILIQTNELREAESIAKTFLKKNKNSKEILCQLGRIYNIYGLIDDAIKILNTCIKLNPNCDDAFFFISNSYAAKGNINKAKQLLDKCIKINPLHYNAHLALSHIIKYTLIDTHIKEMEVQLQKVNHKSEANVYLNFALGKAYEDIGMVDKSFQHYQKGNAKKNENIGYSQNKLTSLLESIKTSYDRLLQSRVQKNEIIDGPSPIFIIGMPRSGTTLVEQILSLHSEICSGGELDFVHRYGGYLIDQPEKINENSIYEFRQRYIQNIKTIEQLKYTKNHHSFITDKMPNMFFFIGLIISSFPNAKFIHVKRCPEAVCWSNFKHIYRGNNQSFSYDLDNIVDYHNKYSYLMEFWESKYSDNIIKLSYEDLVRDKDNQIKQLFFNLDLDFQDATLHPENNKNYLVTSSMLQARKPIYKGSSEKWKKYDIHLEKYFAKLSY